jgi:plastocyanin
MRSLSLLLVGFAALAMACGGDDDGGTADASTSADAPSADAPVADADPAAPDANPNAPDAGVADANVDAKVSPVEVVPCKGLVHLAVTTSGNSFVLSTTDPVPVGGVVRFNPGRIHNATSGANRTADGLFVVGGGETVCVRFLDAGTYPFYCTVHNPMESVLTVVAP